MAIYKDVESFEKFTHPNDSEDFVFGVGFVLDKLYDLPVADVVEVVRCKGCKLCFILKDGTYVCTRTLESVKQDDFCSWGERKE